jgi:hypothetical protein
LNFPLIRVSLLYRREDTINKAFPIDVKRTTARVIEMRRRILGSTPHFHQSLLFSAALRILAHIVPLQAKS